MSSARSVSARRSRRSAPASAGRWTFFSNHSHVLHALALRGDPTIRELADAVGITERAVQHILDDLEQAGVLRRRREGRRNRYDINPDVPLRHPIEAHRTVRDLLEMLKR